MRRKDPEGSIPHTAKPDADNLAKAVLDVCTDLGIWRDDSQITLLRVGKLYAGKVGTPGCRIVIEEKAS
jgi:Holliday junction resolvase RusA-like endonuclease